jgi:hypothetical protein
LPGIKHSSLLGKFINYVGKKFYNIVAWSFCEVLAGPVESHDGRQVVVVQQEGRCLRIDLAVS